jgi:hypothetical protein
MTGTLRGVYVSDEEAKLGLEELKQAGFTEDDVRCVSHPGNAGEARDEMTVIVRVKPGNSERAQEILRRTAIEVHAHEAEGEVDDFSNFGSDGGTSQWGQRVLSVRDDEVVVADRTVSRDEGSRKFD